jgi:hypothetical protein
MRKSTLTLASQMQVLHSISCRVGLKLKEIFVLLLRPDRGQQNTRCVQSGEVGCDQAWGRQWA